MQIPIGAESNFVGIIDLMDMQARIWDGTGDDMGATWNVTDIPDDLKDVCQEYRDKMVEAIAETDESLMEKYFEDGDLDGMDLQVGIRNATIAGTITPVLCGSAFKNKGVQMLLDAVVNYLPSPKDVPAGAGRGPQVGRGHGARGVGGRAVQRPGLQDHDRPLRREAHLLPGVLRPGRAGQLRGQLDQGQEGALRPHPADARQLPGGPRGRIHRRHRRGRRDEAHHHR